MSEWQSLFSGDGKDLFQQLLGRADEKAVEAPRKKMVAANVETKEPAKTSTMVRQGDLFSRVKQEAEAISAESSALKHAKRHLTAQLQEAEVRETALQRELSDALRENGQLESLLGAEQAKFQQLEYAQHANAEKLKVLGAALSKIHEQIALADNDALLTHTKAEQHASAVAALHARAETLDRALERAADKEASDQAARAQAEAAREVAEVALADVQAQMRAQATAHATAMDNLRAEMARIEAEGTSRVTHQRDLAGLIEAELSDVRAECEELRLARKTLAADLADKLAEVAARDAEVQAAEEAAERAAQQCAAETERADALEKTMQRVRDEAQSSRAEWQARMEDTHGRQLEQVRTALKDELERERALRVEADAKVARLTKQLKANQAKTSLAAVPPKKLTATPTQENTHANADEFTPRRALTRKDGPPKQRRSRSVVKSSVQREKDHAKVFTPLSVFDF